MNELKKVVQLGGVEDVGALLPHGRWGRAERYKAACVCSELVKPRKRSSLGCIRVVGALLQQRFVDAKAQCRYAGQGHDFAWWVKHNRAWRSSPAGLAGSAQGLSSP